MKSKVFSAGIIGVTLLVIGLAFVGCSNGTTDEETTDEEWTTLPATNGKLTITNAASINGKYVVVTGDSMFGAIRARQEPITFVGKKVEGGTIEIPLYVGTDPNNITGYSETETIYIVVHCYSHENIVFLTDTKDSTYHYSNILFTVGVGTIDLINDKDP
jgi:hypothetical protein